MPFKSKAQMRKFFTLEEAGKLKPGTAEAWARETPSVAALPEKKKKKPAFTALQRKLTSHGKKT